MELIDRIRKFAEANITDPNQYLVEVDLTARSGPKKVVLIIDGDKGINIDDCTNLSRAVGKLLEDGNFIDDQYTLEVSTPGLDHPLKLKRQYYKKTGEVRDNMIFGLPLTISTLCTMALVFSPLRKRSLGIC